MDAEEELYDPGPLTVLRQPNSDFWKEAFRRDRDRQDRVTLHPDDLRPHVLRVAWRLARYLSNLKNPEDAEEGALRKLPKALTPAEVYQVAGMIGAIRGTADSPVSSELALTYLTANPQDWPRLRDLQDFEHVLIEDAMRRIADQGPEYAREHLRYSLGLNESETLFILAAARRLARKVTEVEVEDDRAMLSLRLDNVARRTRKVGDLRGEIAALRALGVVRGVARAEPDDLDAAFVRAADKVVHERKALTVRGAALDEDP